MVRLLVSHRADSSLGNSVGWTPLHHATLHGHTETCRLLLEEDCDGRAAALSARNKFGATPLNVATAGGHLSSVK